MPSCWTSPPAWRCIPPSTIPMPPWPTAGCGISQPGARPAFSARSTGSTRIPAAWCSAPGNAFAAPLLAQSARKCYLAIAEGSLPAEEGRIDAPHRPAGGIPSSGAWWRPAGKPSATRYRVLGRGGGYSLVACLPLTAAPHQIRVHFSHLGCPLAGDTLYGGHADRIARHALHCAALSFRHPLDGRLCRLLSPLPADMAELCAGCGIDPALPDLFAWLDAQTPPQPCPDGFVPFTAQAQPPFPCDT